MPIYKVRTGAETTVVNAPSKKDAIQIVTDEYDIVCVSARCDKLDPKDIVFVASGDIVKTKSPILSSSMD